MSWTQAVMSNFGARKLMCGKWASQLQHRNLTRAPTPKFNKQVVSDERKRMRAGSNKQGKVRCSGTQVSKIDTQAATPQFEKKLGNAISQVDDETIGARI